MKWWWCTDNWINYPGIGLVNEWQSERRDRVYSDEDGSPPGRLQFMIDRLFCTYVRCTLCHICFEMLSEYFFCISCWMCFFFLRALQLRSDKRNSNVLKYNSLNTSYLELRFGNLIICFSCSNIHTLHRYTECGQSMRGTMLCCTFWI